MPRGRGCRPHRRRRPRSRVARRSPKRSARKLQRPRRSASACPYESVRSCPASPSSFPLRFGTNGGARRRVRGPALGTSCEGGCRLPRTQVGPVRARTVRIRWLHDARRRLERHRANGPSGGSERLNRGAGSRAPVVSPMTTRRGADFRVSRQIAHVSAAGRRTPASGRRRPASGGDGLGAVRRVTCARGPHARERGVSLSTASRRPNPQEPSMATTATRLLDNYIAGRWTPATAATDELDVTNPATGEVLARVPLSGAADLDVAVRAARDALGPWREVSTIGRARKLFELRERLVARPEGPARAGATGVGKTLGDAGAAGARMVGKGGGAGRGPPAV